MTTKDEQNRITDEDYYRKYFTITPQIVWAYCRDVYDLSLWHTIKMITGETYECRLSTRDLAALSMMSIGKVKDCRKHLLKVGLLEGEIRRDPGYQLPVWHLRMPYLWRRNFAWRMELGDLLKDRVKLKIEQKKRLRNGKEPSEKELGSPHEQPRSPHEQPRSPHVHKEEPRVNPVGEPPPTSEISLPSKNGASLVLSSKKYPNGITLGELAVNDRRYLEWAVNEADGFQDLKAAGRRVLDATPDPDVAMPKCERMLAY